jgi:uncharacterized protein involved in outer membrane biogenesis
MRWKKLLLISALLIIALIVTVYVILATYDFNKFKPRIIQAVREAIGRELTLGGDLKVELGLSTGISIEDVSFQNAAWGSQAEMAGVKRLEVQVALLPLIRGRIEFERLILVEPNFLFEFNQSGESNLYFGGSGEPGGTLPALIFHEVEIEKGTFTYKDDELNKTLRLILDRLSFDSTANKKPSELAVKGTFNGRPFEIGGFLDHFALSPRAGEDLPVKLAAKFGESEVTIEGEIEDLIKGEGLAFSLLAEGKTIRDIGKVAGIRGVPDLGPFKFATTVTGSFRRLAAEDIDLNIGADKLVAVNINGNIEDLLTQQGIKLKFTARGKDLAGLEKLIGQPLPMEGAFSISGKIYDTAPKIYTITELKTRLDINEISGSIDLDLTAQRPKISTTLSSQKLDLRPILSGLDKKSRRAGPSAQGAKKGSENVPEELLTQDLLTVADVDLKLHLNNILLPQLTLNEFSAHVMLKDGRITLAAEGPSLPDISELTGMKGVPKLGPFKVSFDLTDPLEKLSVENLVFNAGAPTLADLKLTGAIKEPLARRGIELNFSVRGQDVAKLEKFSGQPLPIRGAFSVSGQIIDSSANIYKLRNFRAVLGDNKIGGTADFNLIGQRPQISAALSSQKIDLEPLFSSLEEKSTATKQPAEGVTEKRNLLSEIPLTSEALTRANADVNIRIEQIRLPRLALDDLTIDMILQDGHVTLTVASKSITKLAELTSVARLTQLGTVRLVIKASSLRDKLAVEKLDFDAHIEDIVTVTLDATAEDFLTQQGITIDFNAQGNDISKLEKLAGPQLPYKEAFTISGRIDDPAINVYKFSALKFTAGDNDLSGWVDLNLTGDRPKIKAELISQNLDLRWLSTTTDRKVGANQASTTVSKKRKKIFPNEPLPLDALKIADLDIKIRAEQIMLPRVVISELTVDIMLEDGHLVVKPLGFSAGDGSIQGYLDTHLEGQAVVIATDLKIDQVQIVSTLHESEISEILEGTIDSKIMINSQGDSIAALMAGLNGNATIIHQGGRIDNRYLSLVGGNLMNELLKRVNVFNQKQKYIETNCTVIHSDINAGLAENVFLLDTRDTKLIGAGKVNLHNETLDFVFKTSPKKGIKIPFLGRVGWSLGELTKPFKVSGTFSQPSLVIDPSRTAVTLGKLTGGLMLGPAGLAVVFADVSKKDVDPCREAINAIEKEDQDFMELKSFKEKSSLKKTTKTVIEGTKEATQDASGAIEKLFSR